MTSAYLVAENSTSGLSGSDSAAFWREHVTLNQGALDFCFAPDADFWGRTIVQRSPEHQLIEYSSGAVSYTRTGRHARNDDDRSMRFVMPASGSIVVETEDTALRVGPGAVAVLSMTSSFTLHHEGGTHAWILSTREGSWPSSLTGGTPRLLDVRSGLGAIAATTLRGLSRQRATLEERDFRQLCDHVCELLATCAGRQDPAPSVSIESAARQLVRLRGADPALTPTAVARELGWSLRRLQTALHDAGTTPADLIREARLDRARAHLCATECRDRTISDIAHDCGFGSLSAFNTAFRERYDQSPREARRQASDGRT